MKNRAKTYLLIEMCASEFGKYLMYSYVVLCIIMLFPKTKGDNCNEAVCASVVSKCLLMQKCQCKLSDCYCLKDCIKCFSDLYTQCCSCLDMCPKHNDSLSYMAPKSQIGDLKGDSEIFEKIAAYKNAEKWTTISVPMDTSTYKQDPDTANCTVVYWNICQTKNKCKKYCEGMGAKSYRWFQDGCCECVGSNCCNYGIIESRCSACPNDKMMRRNKDNYADYAGENKGGIIKKTK